jgi:AraC family transcriptional regulator of adaptative response/methylated-DNA-[protein]-cysteine methyltransferase
MVVIIMGSIKKANIGQLLDERNFSEIAALALNSNSVVRYLMSYLYSTDDLQHWRAAEALGHTANAQYINKINDGRNIPQRLFWSLMEESGATAWPATEALGAVVSLNPSAFADFSRIIMSFIDDPVLRRGVLWSARKISEKRPDLLQDFTSQIIELLKDADPLIRGHAAWSLGVMRDRAALKGLEALKADNNHIYIYENAELIPKTVYEIATDSMATIKK